MESPLQKIFDERKNPTHVGAREVHDAMDPILNLAALLDQQMAIYRKHHLNAKTAIHDVKLDGKQERIKQTLRVVQEASTAFIGVGERLCDAMVQLERYLDEDEQDVLRYEENQRNPRKITDVVLSGPQHDELQQRSARLKVVEAELAALKRK